MRCVGLANMTKLANRLMSEQTDMQAEETGKYTLVEGPQGKHKQEYEQMICQRWGANWQVYLVAEMLLEMGSEK